MRKLRARKGSSPGQWRALRTGALTWAACLLLPLGAAADVITFDDISEATVGTIPDGYQGFSWNNFGFIDGGSEFAGSGYHNGTVSGSYVGFNENAQIALASGGLFTLDSAYLTAAWNTGLSVKVDGLVSGTQIFTNTFVVDPYAPTQFNFNWSGIDSLRFTSFGGVNAGLGSSGSQFAIDNLSFTQVAPEPSVLLLLGPGLLLLAGLRRARR